MERISRTEIESSVDSFPDLDYKFEHINWADIMDAEEASNPELKLQVLQQKSCNMRTDELFRSSILQSGLPSLNSLNLEDHSRGLPPLDTKQLRGINNGTVPSLVSFSGVLNKPKPKPPVNHIPESKPKELFKIPAIPKQTGKRSLEDSGHNPNTETKSIRLPPSPSSLHDTKRIKISENSFNRDWKSGDDDFIFTSDLDWRSNSRADSCRLPIPHSVSVSTLESDAEIETSSAFSDTSSTSTLTSKRSRRTEELPIITDVHKLEQRQKQIDYGKNTDGYQNYIQLYPKYNRKPDMPRTPDKHIGYSHRRWLGLLTKWRKALHKWDGMNTSILAPKNEFHSHFEDANIFPGLSLEERSPTIHIPVIQTEVLSYSDILQNIRQENIDQQEDTPVATTIECNNQDLSVKTQASSMIEEIHCSPMSYASVLKTPISIQVPKITQTQQEISQLVIQPVEDKALGANIADNDKEDETEFKENIPPVSEPIPPSKLTYSQVLTAPKPPQMSVEEPRNVNLPTAKEPENIDNIKEQIPQHEDSMEVDTQSNDIILGKNTPKSYSQVLKSHPPVKQVNSDTINNNAIGTEVVNEEDNNCRDSVKIIEIPPKAESSNPTYSQVLIDQPTTVKQDNIVLNGLNEEALLSEDICDTDNTNYHHLIPQNKLSLQEQS
ncbi:Histone RNA hairpin-binding protein [Oopsacas minuta]|uniref:Histone RNA hairpin-binding protein n=1 Tax=Oopsacas minuta TaxID=111878 RepID=A0AAV7JSX2_9METZ|nr:Histone RNA hairpin-binding protein [Oopsacas minuta]